MCKNVLVLIFSVFAVCDYKNVTLLYFSQPIWYIATIWNSKKHPVIIKIKININI